MFAEVAVNAAAPIRQTFTYRIPGQLAHIQPGHAVYVPFGARTLQGIVIEVTDTPAFAEARDIEAIIDEQPLVSPERIELARWMAEHYLAPLFDCVSLMLPPGFKQKPLTFLRPAFWTGDSSADDLPDSERTILALITERGEIDADEAKKAARGGARAVSSLIKKGLIARTYRLARPSVAEKHVSTLRLLIDEDDARTQAGDLRASDRKPALRRAAILEALADDGAIPLAHARAIGLTPALLRDLQAEGVAAVEDVQVLRDPLAGREYTRRMPPQLTTDQQRATDAICASISVGKGPSPDNRTFLLHGVNGSGKTEVYLAALDRAVSLGKRAIVLVPEIALTPQTLRRFAERFPGRVAVMHS